MPESAANPKVSDPILSAKRFFEVMLNEFEITWVWARANIHSMDLQVWVFNKRMPHTCTISSEQAATNSRAELRRKLLSVNAPRKIIMNPPPDRQPEPLGVPISVAVPRPSFRESRVADTTLKHDLLSSSAMPNSDQPASPPSPISPLGEAVLDDNTARAAESITPSAPLKEPQSENSPSDQPVFPPAASPVNSNNNQDTSLRIDSAVVYQTKILNAAKVIVLDLPKGLMIEDDSVLIIPLHDPTKFLDLRKSHYEALFDVATVPVPVQTAAPRQEQHREEPAAKVERSPAPPPSPAPVVVEGLAARAHAAFTARSPERSEPIAEQPPVIKETPPAPRMEAVPTAEEAAPPPPPQPTTTTTTPPQPPKPVVTGSKPATPTQPRRAAYPVSPDVRSVEGVSSQIARHMAAVAVAQRISGKPHVPVRALYEMLEERDYKQVSARMPTAVKLGFAERHDIPGQPLQFSITPLGHALLARLHTWPWEREQMAIPKWANF